MWKSISGRGFFHFTTLMSSSKPSVFYANPRQAIILRLSHGARVESKFMQRYMEQVKYESTLLAYATSCISPNPVDLYNICEQNLQTLPKSSLKTLEALNIRVHNTNLFFDANHQGELQNEDLRASAYIYNLLKRLGDKKCALCDCCVPEIIQGAHIWSVSSIKSSNLQPKAKFMAATNGSNGLWLCQNHHKLFDANLLFITDTGEVKASQDLTDDGLRYVKSITRNTFIDKVLMNEDFRQYLHFRNNRLELTKCVDISSALAGVTEL